MKRNVRLVTQAAVIAAAYVVLTLPFAQFAFGMIQFRLAEALTVLAALTPAAIPGLALGCLLTNTLYPSGLGLIDIVFGSLATLIAASLTWMLKRRLMDKGIGVTGAVSGTTLDNRIDGKTIRKNRWLKQVIVLSPAAFVNALVVGFYLPFLIPDTTVTPLVIGGFMLSIFISECIVIYLIGMPLLLALRKTGLAAGLE